VEAPAGQMPPQVQAPVQQEASAAVVPVAVSSARRLGHRWGVHAHLR
jgi:hypothetical protein